MHRETEQRKDWLNFIANNTELRLDTLFWNYKVLFFVRKFTTIYSKLRQCCYLCHSIFVDRIHIQRWFDYFVNFGIRPSFAYQLSFYSNHQQKPLWQTASSFARRKRSTFTTFWWSAGTKHINTSSPAPHSITLYRLPSFRIWFEYKNTSTKIFFSSGLIKFE